MLTCHDIQLAVHSCARYSNCPKQEHGEAVKYIARYLKGTLEVGMLFHPKKNDAFRVYGDANLLVIGLRSMQNLTLLQLNPGQAGLSLMPIVQFCGSHRLPSVLLRQNIFLCPQYCKMLLLWWIWQKNYGISSILTFFVLTLMFFAMLLRITCQARWDQASCH